MPAGRLRPPSRGNYLSPYLNKGGAPNNFRAPSQQEKLAMLHQILYRNGYRKATPGPIRKGEMGRIISACLNLARAGDAKAAVSEKADLYDELMTARAAGGEITLTRKEYEALLDKAEILNCVDRDERQKAIGRHKRESHGRQGTRVQHLRKGGNVTVRRAVEADAGRGYRPDQQVVQVAG